MLAFQEANNRLSYTEGNAMEEPATVQDKSFQLVEDAPPPVEPTPEAEQKKSLFSEVRGFFSR